MVWNARSERAASGALSVRRVAPEDATRTHAYGHNTPTDSIRLVLLMQCTVQCRILRLCQQVFVWSNPGTHSQDGLQCVACGPAPG